jgi:hypothetical protein
LDLIKKVVERTLSKLTVSVSSKQRVEDAASPDFTPFKGLYLGGNGQALMILSNFPWATFRAATIF